MEARRDPRKIIHAVGINDLPDKKSLTPSA
jgi:hypothetical protein